MIFAQTVSFRLRFPYAITKGTDVISLLAASGSQIIVEYRKELILIK